MKIKQLELLLPKTLSSIRAGSCFLWNNTLFMRTKPTGYILNSTLISGKMGEGQILCLNLESGTLYFMAGDREVEPVEATLEWKKQ